MYYVLIEYFRGCFFVAMRANVLAQVNWAAECLGRGRCRYMCLSLGNRMRMRRCIWDKVVRHAHQASPLVLLKQF